MKNFLATAFLFSSTALGFAQGTVRFSNDTSDLSSPPDRFVRWSDLAANLNPAYTQGSRVFSNGTPGLRAQLYYGSSTANISELVSVAGAPTTFKSSTSANVGTWFARNATLNGFTSGTVNLQVRVWDISLASSYEAADALGSAYTGLIGESLIFQYAIPTDPLAPLTAFNMNNFQGFGFPVLVQRPILTPEPSTVLLGLIGGAALLASRRSRHHD